MGEVDKTALAAKVQQALNAAHAIDATSAALKREKAAHFDAVALGLRAYWATVADDAATAIAFAAAICKYEDNADNYRRMASNEADRPRRVEGARRRAGGAPGVTRRQGRAPAGSSQMRLPAHKGVGPPK